MKFAHFRPLLVVFVALLAGLFTAGLAGIAGWWVILIVIGVGAAALAVCFVPWKSAVLKTQMKAAGKVLVLGLAVILIAQPMFFIVKATSEAGFTPGGYPVGHMYEITGVIDGTPLVREKVMYIRLRDVVAEYNFQQTHIKEKLRLTVFLNNATEEAAVFGLQAGNKIWFASRIESTPVFEEDGSINGFSYADNTLYAATAHFTDVKFLEAGEKNFTEKITGYVGNILRQGMGNKYGGFALAVLLGDRSGIDMEMRDNFRDTGVAHLIAISGLHVGFIVLMLMWLLVRCKLSVKWQTVIVAAFLLFYCIICGLSPSVLRASLMAVFILLGRCFGEQYDPLSSVSLAGILILLFAPLYAFNLGFLLSFASVFCIFLLMPIFMSWFRFLPKFLSSTIAVTLAATIGTAPLIIMFFGTFPIYTLLTNLVVVPLFGIVYCVTAVMLIVCLLTSWFLPWMPYILKLPSYGYLLLDWITAWIAKWPFAVAELYLKPFIGTVCYYVGIFAASRFCLLLPKIKMISAGVLFGICAVEFVLMQVIV
ncbi:MAG: ComEC/Rec2 family competence protein [Firmicutes bacterium]|nr:ComEC/Rec2 family competence protein [Bacillota bacterium]